MKDDLINIIWRKRSTKKILLQENYNQKKKNKGEVSEDTGKREIEK